MNKLEETNCKVKENEQKMEILKVSNDKYNPVFLSYLIKKDAKLQKLFDELKYNNRKKR